MGKNNKTQGKKGKVTKKKKSHKVLKSILLIILLTILICAGVFTYKVYKNGGGLAGFVTTLVGTDPEKTKSLPDFYCLLMGKSQNMTDTIIVAKYSPSTGESALLSIPRDSFVGTNKNAATASDKINSKYQISPQKTIDAVNQLTGLNIKYYVTVDTSALRNLVDAIGGVYFDVPIDMDYDDSSQKLYIHLKAGPQLLNGEQAEWVVRFRHNNDGTSYPASYGDNDLGRMKTQREFIMEVAKQTLKVENITKVDDILKIAEEEVETNIDWDTMMEYVPALLSFDSSKMKTGTLPGTPQYCNGVAVYLVNEKESKELVNELFLSSSSDTNVVDGNAVANETIAEGTVQKNYKVEILNGTGSSAKLEKAVEQLTAQGYKVSKKGNTNIANTTTIINRSNKTKSDENEIRALLGTGTAITGENNSNVDFTIILGKDY